jgi:hypothetical protein
VIQGDMRRCMDNDAATERHSLYLGKKWTGQDYPTFLIDFACLP